MILPFGSRIKKKYLARPWSRLVTREPPYHDAIYRAHFPYADYHLTNQKSASATVIGAQIERANKGSEQ